ncbi:hypothetical protein Glove_162g77 [Diversispora epigaea]|uniref:HCP-like protein n=1 Tax=Diversispora epigaea TaxID=1348612 RepID=A0A397IR77_9GLOM|nr:hypothetical protein Glove_162g77 [Diversispora epigaea]
MCNTGFCYDYGTGVERDKGEAFKWYLRAAEKGHSLAQHNLGWCYKNGEGIEKNQAEAFKWFDKAANNGYIDSQFMGCGTEKDIVKAICWLNIAKERGDSDANDLLKEIISKGIESRNKRYSRTSTIPFYGKESRTCKKITHLDSRYDTIVTGKLHDPVYGSTGKRNSRVFNGFLKPHGITPKVLRKIGVKHASRVHGSQNPTSEHLDLHSIET